MLIVLPIIALIAIVLALYTTFPEWGWRRAILRGGITWAVFASLLIELLSLVHAVKAITLGITWVAFLVIAGNTHYIFAVFSCKVRIFIDQGLPHTFGMINILAEYYALVVAVGALEKFGNLLGDKFGPLA